MKAAVSKLLTKDPRVTHPKSPPLLFEPGSSENSFANSEKESPCSIFVFMFFKVCKDVSFEYSLGLTFYKTMSYFCF